ncbi:MAG: cadherin repeat domain-containing protein [Gammaproteobacteria bacterium]
MTTFNRVTLLVGLITITACGGGGGGGGDSYTAPVAPTNNAPTITNTTGNYSVVENQTSAFTVTASDPDGDSLTYSINGTDSSLFTISSSGVVTFNAAPDYENPSDSGTNNVYDLSASVSDGSLSASKDFMVTVTNDTSDDITTEGYDGTYIGAGPIQGATVCIEATTGTCTGAEFTATTAQDGTFSITVDSGTTGALRGEGGFDPVTNLQFSEADSAALGQPVTDQNFVVSPISDLMNEFNNSSDYDTFKSKLGLDSNFMIRFDNPFESLTDAASNRAAVVNTQILILYYLLEGIHTFANDDAKNKIASAIYNRTGSETSLGDTTFIKDMLTNLDSDFSPTSDQLVSLSAGISAYMQKINANSSNSHSHFAKAGVSELNVLMKAVMDGTSSPAEIDKLIFNTISWINENTSWDGGSITDNEASLSETTYALSNNGSSNYIVDNINTKDTEFIIYVKEGDVIKFDATSSVTSSHPFLMSTENNDMDMSNDVGTSEGWDKDTLTLTVGASTPETLYPHCEFHSGMYTNSKIVKVTSYNQSNIDITNNSNALQVKGTVATGPFKGASGFTYKVYLTSQGGSEHTHTFDEYPGLTFYMPGSQGYHGAEAATDDTKFKPKSHYAEDDDNSGGGYTY